ncbi:hypothetical protein [Symmachiella dynata]|uniref:hypothetical protein n=1 Tax=Symmachiella dynata TaxID=2527995 RepID=UPI0011A6C197|nr:hypothetical protein [Symmachiella dynata]
MKDAPINSPQEDEVLGTVLAYESPVSGDPRNEQRFDRMLDMLGVNPETDQLVGTDEQVIEALDSALRLSPRTR